MDFIKGINNFFRENRKAIIVGVVGSILATIIISNFGYIKDKFSSWFTSPSETKEWRSKYIDEKLERYAYYNTEEAKRLYVPTRYQEDRPDMDEVAKPDTKNPTHKELIPYFLNTVFVNDNPNRFYCVLAETGMGKTTFLVQLLIAYINKYTEKTLPYDIRILPLADEDVIEQITKLPDSSKTKTILLLDALDENVNAYDRKDSAGNIISTYEKFREELEQAVEPFRFVVITCRTQFFPDNKSELKELRYGQHTFPTPDKSLPRYKRLYISPFSDKDIDEYIGKKYKWKGEKMRKAKKIIGSIKSLAVRPLILSYIDDLMDGEVNNVLDAYRLIIDKWLQREVNHIQDEEVRNRQKKLLYDLSSRLAVYIDSNWAYNGGLYLTQAEYEAFKTENTDFDSVDFSFATKSLITRDNQHNILFAHKSILEYLCAERVFLGMLEFSFEGRDMAKTFFELFCQADEKELLPDESEADKARRYNEIGWIYNYEIGDHDKALEYYKKELKINEKVLGTEHYAIPRLYENIGSIYYEIDDYDNSLENYMKALIIEEKISGPENTGTATLYNNIGDVYSKKGDYDKALEYYMKTLIIYVKVFGPENTSTATLYKNIGDVYSKKGDYDKALEYYMKTLIIYVKVFGPEYYVIPRLYENIGSIYYEIDDYDNSLENYMKALIIEEKISGPEDSDTKELYSKIGYVYERMGNKDEAQKWYDKANK